MMRFVFIIGHANGDGDDSFQGFIGANADQASAERKKADSRETSSCQRPSH